MRNKLYTLGYTGRKPAEIVEIAKTLRAKIVDIRLTPISRAAQWNGYTLNSFLDRHGIRYEHIKDLGNINYQTTRPVEIKDLLIGCLRLRTLLEESPCVILCACEHWNECHRQHVAEYMAVYHGYEIEHIGDTADNCDHADQMTLF